MYQAQKLILIQKIAHKIFKKINNKMRPKNLYLEN
jgi:hypothetical protein